MSSIYRAASPYGRSTSPNPYGRSSSPNPYGQPPASPYAQPATMPYGQPTSSVYGQPAGSAYGHQTPSHYGQAATSPYAQPATSPYAQTGASAYATPATSPYAQTSAPAYGARAASPYAPPMAMPQTPGTAYGDPGVPQPQTQGQAGIQPGSITYTTSTGPDGRLVYHPFKAVPASYKTSAGVVTGIQWVPAEATSIVPNGAQPADNDFVASWTRTGRLNADEERSVKEWQRDEDRRRRREERDSTRRLRDKSQVRERSSVRGDDFELERARQRDASARQRRKSFVAEAPYATAQPYGVAGMPGGTSPYAPPGSPYAGSTAGYGGSAAGGYAGSAAGGYAGSAAGGYGSGAPSGYTRERKYSTGEQLASHMADLDLDRGVDYSTRSSRRRSTADPYGSNAGGPVYPRGHVMEGQPIPPGAPIPQARSRATTPAPPGHSPLPGTASSAYGGPVTFPSAGLGGASPNIRGNLALAGGPPIVPETGQLAPPESFLRPPNAAMPYTPFNSPMYIAEMADIIHNIPPMPLVLGPHDIIVDDWSRMMADLAGAWAGALPIATDGRRQKRSSLVAHMLDAWNSNFYTPRGIEVVLYKGRERRSGPGAGIVDGALSPDQAQLSSAEESDTTESELDDENSLTGGAYGGAYGAPAGGAYGRGADGVYGRHGDAMRREERKRRRREKRARRREREMHRTYSIHVVCLPHGGPGGAGATVQPPIPGTPGNAMGMGMASPYHRGY
ncbi:hypothetical protein BD626DRAFT_545522 [Schizophyllum amplum]|uniref:Uncharacterized protein n=1 Tax=Schizophyllum amplum TaxID=97359 RepID=A0A550CUG1_9AGAR|nr:hypothetical protein BD626DRAFT_545522 [Auriculariopsis ampla]